MIAFACPRCKQSLTIADSAANTKVRCPSCNQKTLVPTPAHLTDKTMLGIDPTDKTMIGIDPASAALPPEEEKVKQAILFILKEDDRFAKSTKCQPGATATPATFCLATGKYCDLVEQLDLSDCPADFRVAYRQHLRAWRETQHATSQYPDNLLTQILLGAWNGVVKGEMDGGSGRILAGIQKAMDRVHATWEEVEKIGARYGAAL